MGQCDFAIKKRFDEMKKVEDEITVGDEDLKIISGKPVPNKIWETQAKYVEIMHKMKVGDCLEGFREKKEADRFIRVLTKYGFGYICRRQTNGTYSVWKVEYKKKSRGK